MNRQQRRRTARIDNKPIKVEQVNLTPDKAGKMLVRGLPPGPVTLDERQGVFAFVIKCPACAVEAVILSWRRDRPDELPWHCPECAADVVVMNHIILSQRRAFGLDPQQVEIYRVPAILEKAAEPAPPLGIA